MNLPATDRDAELIRYYIDNKCTYQEVATKYGLTRERIRQILVKKHITKNPRKHKPHKNYNNVCANCGKEFESRRSDKKYCNKDCTSLAVSNKLRKLSDKDLVDIFNLYYVDQMTGKDIARLYDIHYTAVYALLAGRNYTVSLKQLGLYDKYINPGGSDVHELATRILNAKWENDK
jgi:predicted DNA-binding protein YlxM (UPF0122 family)